MRCVHPDILGITRIEDREYGLCTECLKIIDVEELLPNGLMRIFIKWITENPQEAKNFELWNHI